MPRLRAATPADVPVILRLVRDLAEYERAPDAVVATEEDFLRHGFGPRPRFSVLLADEHAYSLSHTTATMIFYSSLKWKA